MKIHIGVLTVVLWGIGTLAGVAQGQVEGEKSPTTEERLRRLESAPVVKAGKDGFWIKSADDAYSLRLGGYVQVDGRFGPAEESATSNDTFLLRTVRPIIEGVVAKDFGFRVMPDFGDGRTWIPDAYGEWKRLAEFRIRAGKFKEPVGLERLQSATDLRFSEVGLPTNLVPNRDIGVMAYGEFEKGVLSYQTGIFNGNADAGSNDRDVDEEKDIVGRLFVHPFRNLAVEPLQGLGVGVAGTHGIQDGAGALGSYRSARQETFFRYRSTVTADGDHTRVAPQGYWYYGPVGILGEWVRSFQDVSRAGQDERLENTAWQVQASFLVTGENESYKGIDPQDATWGAWEIAARYGRLDVDDGAFPFYADGTVSAGSARSRGVGLNGYLKKNVKTMLDYELVTFDDGSVDGDRRDESTVFVRFQVSF